MGNFLGSTYVNEPVQSSINLPLIQSVLAAKQGQYDTNKAKIQSGLEQLSQLQVLRPQDKEYIQAKMQDITTKINNYGENDLSQSFVADDMFGMIKSAARDPFILSAIENTTKLSKVNTEIAEKKKKGDGSYNDLNYTYMLEEAGVSDYMSGKRNDIGNLQYNDYVDLTKVHLDKLKVIKDLKGKRFIETIDNNGTIQRKEIDGMTNQEIQNYFGSMISPSELKQLEINGWSKYGGNEKEARKYYGEYNDKLASNYEEKLKTLEAKKNNNTLPPNEIEEAKLEIESVKTSIELAKENSKNKESVGIKNIYTFLEKANYLNGISKMASTEWSYEYKLDPIWKAKEDLKIQYEDLEIKRKKEKREEMEFGLKMAKEYNIDENGNPITEDRTSVSTRRDALPEDVSGIKSLQQASTEQFNIVIDSTKELMSKLDDRQKKHFIQELKERGVDQNLQKIGKGRVVITDAIREAFDATGLGNYKQYAEKITEAALKKDAIARDIITVEKDSYTEAFNKNPEKYLNNIVTSVKDVGEVGGKGLEKVKENIDKIKNLYKKATGKNLEVKIDILGQAYPVGKDGRDIGWYKITTELKPKLSSNPILLRELADIQSSSGKKELKEDSTPIVENKLKDYSSSGKVSTFTVYDNINILRETDKNNIIKRIPQDRLSEGGNFNPKLGITLRQVGKNIEILQYQGQIKGEDDKMIPKYAKAVIDPGDVGLYTEISKYIDIEQDKKRSSGFSANSYDEFKPNKPRLQIGNNDKIINARIESAVKESVNNNPNLKQIFTFGTPEVWSTTEAIKKNMKGGLTSLVGEDIASTFTNNYLKNINQFKLQPYTIDDPRTTTIGDKVWAYRVINPEGKTITEDFIGVTNLDKDTKYLLDYQPQVFITESIYQKITEDKDFINQVLTK